MRVSCAPPDRYLRADHLHSFRSCTPCWPGRGTCLVRARTTSKAEGESTRAKERGLVMTMMIGLMVLLLLVLGSLMVLLLVLLLMAGQLLLQYGQ